LGVGTQIWKDFERANLGVLGVGFSGVRVLGLRLGVGTQIAQIWKDRKGKNLGVLGVGFSGVRVLGLRLGLGTQIAQIWKDFRLCGFY
jgi:hypothetical protein